ALFRELAQAACQFLDHAFFPATQSPHVDFRRSEVDPPILRLMRFLDQLGNMQQRFGRDASAIQTYPARVDFGIDERDFHAEIGGEKGCSVSARSAAHDCNAQISVISHEECLSFY